MTIRKNIVMIAPSINPYPPGRQLFASNTPGYTTIKTIPANVAAVKIDLYGANGIASSVGNPGGKGGVVTAIVDTSTIKDLVIVQGSIAASNTEAAYNATDIRLVYNGSVTETASLQSRILVAGGGGSASLGTSNNKGWGDEGAAGGGTTGAGRPGRQNGGSFSRASTGGTQTAGGTGFKAGAFGLGGAGGSDYGGTFGAGGAGWYGGGSGSSAYEVKVGGAGGSSYADPNYCSEVEHIQGGNNTEYGYPWCSITVYKSN